jgi:hypothetical protein
MVIVLALMLFHFHILDIEFSSADNLYALAVAFRAAIIAFLQRKKNIAIPAAQLSRYMCIYYFGPGGDGVLAYKSEVEVHGVFNYAGIIANNQIKADYFSGIGFFSVFKRKVQNRCNDTLFMHEWFIGQQSVSCQQEKAGMWQANDLSGACSK